ncbi:MAG: 16S rRNA (cytidine(1402)-2'-O)-methyltransferase [Desulfovibrio sp.]|jgi:16S rRNA (cytidine1402-2'-O)-methyltransferase|nr:16S rRNA (cytidine(1402)-2'-O)-methyltransferase [Desulfovibrio sp.]
MSSNSGILWVVATPLGNLGDLSPRAREALSGAHRILAEDTRRAGVLLSRCGLRSPGFLSLHEHNEEKRLPLALDLLKKGHNLAMISDAGTPLLADPGYRLVRACRGEGIRVSPLPGPSAPAAALSACGIAPMPFAFLGFAPRRDSDREAFFAPYASLCLSLVFFERKNRIRECLGIALRVLGRREACLAREMTKTHEEFISFSLEDFANLPQDLPGEITVIIGPPSEEKRFPPEDLDRLIEEEAKAGLGARETAKRVRKRAGKGTAREIYRRMQTLAPDPDDETKEADANSGENA